YLRCQHDVAHRQRALREIRNLDVVPDAALLFRSIRDGSANLITARRQIIEARQPPEPELSDAIGSIGMRRHLQAVDVASLHRTPPLRRPPPSLRPPRRRLRPP